MNINRLDFFSPSRDTACLSSMKMGDRWNAAVFQDSASRATHGYAERGI